MASTRTSTRTRSQAPAQPTLPFPRRKSARVAASKPKRNLAEPDVKTTTTTTTTTMPAAAIPAPLSPRRPAAAPLPVSPDAPPARLPLSPRKRTVADNVLNKDAALLLLPSPPKQSKASSSLPSQRRLTFDENGAVSDRRKPTPSSPGAASAAVAASPARPSPREKAAACRLFPEKDVAASAKRALHTAPPERLLSRESECGAIRTFLERTAARRLPGSLYVSGAPGTGKTACLHWVLRHMKEELSHVRTLSVNCMSLRRSRGIFPLLAEKLNVPPAGRKSLQRHLSGPGPAVLLVLDELDQLDSKTQDVLYTIFEWPHLPQSRLCLVGIANALDLTDRILPRLQAVPRCRPLLLNFPPYTRDQLGAIVQDRLAQACADGVLDAAAVQFCARKVSAVSGDARKALDICRRAVEIVQSEHRKKAEHRPEPELCNSAGVPQVAHVLSEVYGDRMAACGGGDESFPLQQKLLACCLLMLVRAGKSKEVHLGKLHEAHSRLCARQQVGGVAQAECLSLCALLESRGIFALKKAKEARLTKVSLKIEEEAVEHALKDRTLVGSILDAGLP
ncbi:cell division control protein 6 homolog [Festucalex cinctus]